MHNKNFNAKYYSRALLLFGFFIFMAFVFLINKDFIVDKSGACTEWSAEPECFTPEPLVYPGSSSGTGDFVTFCDFSHASYNDPIVFPNQENAAHLHWFTGALNTDHNSTYESLLNSKQTTCDRVGDTSAYWLPAVHQDGIVLSTGSGEPMVGTRVYYRTNGRDPNTIRPFPAGLKIIAGDAKATTAQDTHVVSYSCNRSPYEDSIQPTPPSFQDCIDTYEDFPDPDRSSNADTWLRLRHTYPDCWNGVNLDSPNHRSHMEYSSGGSCPASHPVPVPEITIATRLRLDGNFNNIDIGPMLSEYGGHTDFINAWEPGILEDLVTQCIHAAVLCGQDGGPTISGDYIIEEPTSLTPKRLSPAQIEATYGSRPYLPLPADITYDDKVDIVDLSLLLSNWNINDDRSDINRDEIVSIIDLSILLSQWS